nr:S-layer homology domain-containing protein [Bacillus ectoiniformans]
MVPHGVKAEASNEFLDIKPTDHYYEAVKSLHARKIIKGYEDGTFRPHEKLTRAQAAKIIALALKLETNVKDPGFKDVTNKSWEYPFIAAVKHAGIMEGYGDHFKPNAQLSRAQMAKVISLAFGFKEKTPSELPFTDVKKEDWYAKYVTALIEKQVTTGTSPTTYSPNQTVNRGQMASFIFRSEAALNPVQVKAKIIQIKENEVVTDKGSYVISDELKAWLNPRNQEALKGASIHFLVKDEMVEKVQSIELITNGEAGAEVVFDGKGATIDTDIIINGDYLSIKNAIIQGDLKLGEGIKNSFYTDGLKVEGKTTVADEVKTAEKQTTLYQPLSYKRFVEQYQTLNTSPRRLKLVFHNSSFHSVNINKPDMSIELTGATVIRSVDLSDKVTLKAESAARILQAIIGSGVDQVVFECHVKELIIHNNQNITMLGTGNIDTVKASGGSVVTWQISGKVGLLEVVDLVSKFTLGNQSIIVNLIFPPGMKPSDVISNYDKVKGNIDQVGGVKNPDVPPPPASGGGGGGGGGGSPRDTQAPVLTYTGENNFTVDYGETFSIPQISATDNKDPAVEVKKAIKNAAGEKLNEINTSVSGTYTITYTAKDAAGNEATPIVITVVVKEAPDTEAPVFFNDGLANFTVKNGGNFKLPIVDVLDNKDQNLKATIVITNQENKEIDEIDTTVAGTYKITYSAEDLAGNKASPLVITVVVEEAPDTESPVLQYNGEVNLTIEYDSSFTVPDVSATDNKDPSVTVKEVIKNDKDEAIEQIDTKTPGTYTITYTAKDASGNEATPIIITVVVEEPDTEKPILQYSGQKNLTVEYDESFTVPTVTATDNKDKNVEVKSVIHDAAGTELTEIDTTVPGTYTITYTAKDAAGNAADQLVITVVVNKEKDQINNASFTSAAYAEKTITISDLAEIEDGSTFDIAQLTYHDKESSPATHPLTGNYNIVNTAAELDQPGEYFYDKDQDKLIIKLTASDVTSIEGLQGFGIRGTVADEITAAEGWNIDPSLNKARQVVTAIDTPKQK